MTESEKARWKTSAERERTSTTPRGTATASASSSTAGPAAGGEAPQTPPPPPAISPIGSKAPRRTMFRINQDAQDVSDIQYRPMPRLKKEPTKDISESLREAMCISHFNGKTGQFIEQLIDAGWVMTQDHISRGILTQHPDLTRNGVFALSIFTTELRAFVDGATAQDEFYFQFGNALRHRQADDMAKLKPYIYHFIKGMEAMPKYQGTLWRGVHGDFAGVASSTFNLHEIINFNAPSSASPSRDVAKSFLAGNGLLLKLGVINSARDIRQVSAYPNEDERTILAGSAFVVTTEAHRAEDGVLEIHLMEGQMKQY